ncbi:MAG: hypothetical protein VYA34_07220 [Myxococcota bacterium]|nr:hypothetical protein [Myxococcota bacterium]
MQASTVELRTLLKAIQGCDVGTSRWGWDRHYRAALIVTDSKTGYALDEVVNNILPETWKENPETPPPESIANLIAYLSGLRPAQHLHTKILDDANVLFGAFWPWDNESLVSIRIGIIQNTPTLESTYEQQRLVCGIFCPGELPRLH